MDNEHLLPIMEDQDLQEEEADQYNDENVPPQDHNENGNNLPNQQQQQNQQALQNLPHTLKIRYDHHIHAMPYSFWPFNPARWVPHLRNLVPPNQDDQGNFPNDQPHQEPVQEQPPILEDVENGNIVNDQPQDQEPVIQVQPPILQDDEILHDENNEGIQMNGHQEQFQEPVLQEEDDDNGDVNPNGQPQDQEPGLLQEQPPILHYYENGNILNDQPQGQEPVILVEPPILQDDEIQHDENNEGITMNWPQEQLQEPVLQEQDDDNGDVNPNDEPQDQEPGVLQEQPPILHYYENGNILNDQPQDQEPVIQVQPPILQDDEILHDENNAGIPMNGPQEQLQEPVLQEEDDDNGNVNPNDQPQDHEPGVLQEQQPIFQENGENIHNENDDIPPDVRILSFEIRHDPNWSQMVREGEVPPIFSLLVPQIPVSFVVHIKYGQPGPYSASIVTMIPLHLCNDYDEFYARLWHSYEITVGVDLHNQPVENDPIPGYHLNYIFIHPSEQLLDIDGIPWEEFRIRLVSVHAVEYF